MSSHTGMRASGGLLAFLLLAVQPAAAQTFNYTGPSTGTVNWSAGIWTPAVPPAGGGALVDLVFNPLGSGNVTANNNLGNPFQLATLTLASAGGGLKIGNVAGNSLQFADNSIGVGIVQAGIGVAEISAGFNWTATGLTVSGAGLGNLRLTGQLVSASTELTINNPQSLPYTGLVVLTQANIMPSATLIAGNLVLNNNQALGTQPFTINGGTIGGFATMPNAITLNAPLIFNGLGQLNLSGVVSGNQPLIVRPLGGNTLELRNANTYSGSTSCELSPHGLVQAAGTLVLAGVNGSALNSPNFTFNGGGLLQLGSLTTAGNNNNRILDTAPVALSGGQLVLVGAPSTSTSESIGALSGRGATVIGVNASASGNSGTTLAAASLTRNERGQFFFFGGNSFGAPLGPNVANVTFAAAPGPLVGGGGAAGSTTISVLPFAAGAFATQLDMTELVTYGATNGIRPLAASEYAATITSGSVTQNNVALTANSAITAPTTINALVLRNFANFNGSTSTLTVTSGAVVAAADGVTIPSAMTLAFGAAEGNVFMRNVLAVDGPMTGSNGLTVAGFGQLILRNTANNVTGTLTINRGEVAFLDPAVLNSFSNIVVNGTPALQFTPGLAYVGPTTVSVTVNKPLTVTDGYARLGGGGASSTFTFAGQISGPGGVLTLGSNVALTNASNDYTGPTRVLAGNLLISADNVLGNGGGVVFGGSLGTVGPRLTGNWTTSRQIQFTAFGNQVDTNGFTWTVNSPVTGETPSINKIGAGAWVLTQGGALGQSTTSGVLTTTTTVNVGAGELRVTNPTGSATGTATVSISSGGTLSGTGRVAGAVTVASGGFVAPGISSIDTLRFGSSLTINGSYLAEVNSTTSDLLLVSGGLTLGPSSILNLSGTFDPATTYSLAMFPTSAGIFGSVDNLPASHMLVYQTNQITLSPVPEPTLVLLACGVGATLCFRRWRRVRAHESTEVLP